MTAPAKSSPRDAQVMSAILKDMGVTEHEPRLINQMLEFTYRYVTDILDDAKVYSNHSGKKVIDTEDVQLAVQCRMDHSFTTPPPRDLLLEIARHKNSQPLPLIKPYTGPRLPPDRYCLSASNFKLVNKKKPLHRIQIGLPVNQLSGAHRISLSQVQKQAGKVHISTPNQKAQVGMTMGGAGGSMTVINRPSPVPPIVRVQQGGGLLSGLPASGTLSGSPQIQQQSQQVLTSGQSLVTGGVSSISGLINPLKRKHEADDYDQT